MIRTECFSLFEVSIVEELQSCLFIGLSWFPHLLVSLQLRRNNRWLLGGCRNQRHWVIEVIPDGGTPIARSNIRAFCEDKEFLESGTDRKEQEYLYSEFETYASFLASRRRNAAERSARREKRLIVSRVTAANGCSNQSEPSDKTSEALSSTANSKSHLDNARSSSPTSATAIVPFTSISPKNTERKHNGPENNAHRWVELRHTIETLYMEQNKTLTEIQTMMIDEHGFIAK